MRDEVTAYVGLGANLGDAAAAVRGAIASIDTVEGTQVTKQSSLYRTAPVGASGPDYINAVVEVRTRLTAPALLDALQQLEDAAGRERPYRNAPRTLDLDLLLYGSARVDGTRLQVPHPRLRKRAFVLVPLAQVAPHLVNQADLAAVSSQPIARVT